MGIYDPHVKYFEHGLLGVEEAFRGADCVVVLAEHNEFKYMHPLELGKLMRQRTVIDTKRVLNLDAWAEAGFGTWLLGNSAGIAEHAEERSFKPQLA